MLRSNRSTRYHAMTDMGSGLSPAAGNTRRRALEGAGCLRERRLGDRLRRDVDRGDQGRRRSRRGHTFGAGTREAFLARSDEPLPKGTNVLVVGVRGARTVIVEPWTEMVTTELFS
ncbi:hypothetical protein BZL30_3762 [Mycobacterium kansasii]|uniref:Uncharacterized protein n=1 Tax=Mycobacterium kansasii TaxID=1768 RepID=A0A1V3X8D7_MYCKA|nr:hypothetical protein BZL30_3762 [Mycobacterium kansasii]